MQIEYQKEQEYLNSKYAFRQISHHHFRALLGDEKARIGLSFMYNQPAGVKGKMQKCDEDQAYMGLKREAKFEWEKKLLAQGKMVPRDE